MALPSGRLVRGRGLRIDNPYKPDPEFAVYLVGSDLYGVTWEYRWVDWPDFGLPANPEALRENLMEALARSSTERVEVGCVGGRGRTGTALACLAVLDGAPAADAVAYVRQHYSPDAVETLEQASFVAGFR
jgi:protein-tyrosine phosphatase